MENHNFEWVNPLFQWPCSIANCWFTRGYHMIENQKVDFVMVFFQSSYEVRGKQQEFNGTKSVILIHVHRGCPI